MMATLSIRKGFLSATVLGLIIISSAEAIDLTGAWNAEFDTQIGVQRYLFSFRQDGRQVAGSATSDIAGEKRQVTLQNIRLEADKITFTEVLDFQGNEIRIEYAGKSLCYVTDTEHTPGKPDEKILELIDGADVFIYDSSYTDEEYPTYAGYGHSTWQEGVRLARAAGVKRFVAFHHDPSHNDEAMDKIARDLKKMMPTASVAREGMVLKP